MNIIVHSPPHMLLIQQMVLNSAQLSSTVQIPPEKQSGGYAWLVVASRGLPHHFYHSSSTLHTTRLPSTVAGTCNTLHDSNTAYYTRNEVSTRDPRRHASSCTHAGTASLLVTHKNLLW